MLLFCFDVSGLFVIQRWYQRLVQRRVQPTPCIKSILDKVFRRQVRCEESNNSGTNFRLKGKHYELEVEPL